MEAKDRFLEPEPDLDVDFLDDGFRGDEAAAPAAAVAFRASNIASTARARIR